MTRLIPGLLILTSVGSSQFSGPVKITPVVPASYTTELQPPRLLLPARRLRLIRREAERQVPRWTHFNALVKTAAGRLAEPGFSYALHFAASREPEIAAKAITWALSPAATDLRQMALVYDWCQPEGNSAASLRQKIAALLEKKAAASDFGSVRDRVFGALAVAHDVPGVTEKYLKPIVEQWWKSRILDVIAEGRNPIRLEDHFALLEMMHALRDNLDLDLRESAARFFTALPVYHILAHYPAPYPAAENEYRVPLMAKHAEPDAAAAVRSRAAALAMVAYDTNSQEMQFLQGWLMLDRYMMRSVYGASYEFLWANQYQPGLSYHYLPNVFHDPYNARLIIRSSWDDDAVWYYQDGPKAQMFRNGEIRNMETGALPETLTMGNTVLVPSQESGSFETGMEQKSFYYVLGLAPDTRYDLEIDDEEIREVRTDHGGVLPLERLPGRMAVARLRKSP